MGEIEHILSTKSQKRAHHENKLQPQDRSRDLRRRPEPPLPHAPGPRALAVGRERVRGPWISEPSAVRGWGLLLSEQHPPGERAGVSGQSSDDANQRGEPEEQAGRGQREAPSAVRGWGLLLSEQHPPGETAGVSGKGSNDANQRGEPEEQAGRGQWEETLAILVVQWGPPYGRLGETLMGLALNCLELL